MLPFQFTPVLISWRIVTGLYNKTKANSLWLQLRKTIVTIYLNQRREKLVQQFALKLNPHKRHKTTCKPPQNIPSFLRYNCEFAVQSWELKKQVEIILYLDAFASFIFAKSLIFWRDLESFVFSLQLPFRSFLYITTRWGSLIAELAGHDTVL